MGDVRGASAGAAAPGAATIPARTGRVADLGAALRRIVLGYRGVAAGWVAVLAVTGWATGRVGGGAALLTAALAIAWAVVSLGLVRGAERGEVLRQWTAIATDVTAATGTILLPALLSGSGAALAGGYPFSAVVIAAWLRGLPGALAAAGALSIATLARVPLGEAARPDAAGAVPADLVSTVLFFFIGGGVLAWGLDVLRRTGAERDAAEAALVAERADRARVEERAATAAHLHDSVLQTLALIQRRSDDGPEVVSLARSQERALRDWLAGREARFAISPPGVPGADGGGPAPPATLGAALDAAADDVERLHRIAVDVVHVGDAPFDGRLADLVAATREAVVNAAKHAGVGQVQVYAETDAAGTSVFVRDRGGGFDPEAVPADRRGIAHSIVGRLEALGGSAVIRSGPGRGTEVELALPASGDVG